MGYSIDDNARLKILLLCDSPLHWTRHKVSTNYCIDPNLRSGGLRSCTVILLDKMSVLIGQDDREPKSGRYVRSGLQDATPLESEVNV